MSTVHRPAPSGPTSLRRVRQQARDALAVMVFSALTSTALVGGLLLVLSVGR